MEGQNVAVVIPCSSSIHSEVEGTKIIDEGARVCPLCKSEIKLFFINFNEKLLMCENTECEFPFGHEDLQFVKEDEELQSDEELESIKITCRSDSTCIQVPVVTENMSEIDKINQGTKDIQLVKRSNINKYFNRPKSAQKKSAEKEAEIMKNVKDIDGLTKELVDVDYDNTFIQNEKWIMDLKKKQDTSGIQLLKEDEMKLINIQQPVCKRELKINIDPGDANSMSCITIALNDKGF